MELTLNQEQQKWIMDHFYVDNESGQDECASIKIVWDESDISSLIVNEIRNYIDSCGRESAFGRRIEPCILSNGHLRIIGYWSSHDITMFDNVMTHKFEFLPDYYEIIDQHVKCPQMVNENVMIGHEIEPLEILVDSKNGRPAGFFTPSWRIEKRTTGINGRSRVIFCTIPKYPK